MKVRVLYLLQSSLFSFLCMSIWDLLSVLEKESADLKVLALYLVINSDVKIAFDCSWD